MVARTATITIATFAEVEAPLGPLIFGGLMGGILLIVYPFPDTRRAIERTTIPMQNAPMMICSHSCLLYGIQCPLFPPPLPSSPLTRLRLFLATGYPFDTDRGAGDYSFLRNHCAANALATSSTMMDPAT